MWKSLKEWQTLTSGWIDGKFIEIDVKEIKDKADFYTKIVNKCVKNMPSNPVLDKVKHMVH
jgi:dynein heavy chain